MGDGDDLKEFKAVSKKLEVKESCAFSREGSPGRVDSPSLGRWIWGSSRTEGISPRNSCSP